MKKIIAINWISVDGIFSGLNGSTEWFTPDSELEKENGGELSTCQNILLGRVTFKLMEAFWPTKDAAVYPEIQQYMNQSRKHVFSRTVNDTNWENSQFYSKLDKEVIQSIKKEAPGNIVILGSGDLTMQLHELQLMDEYVIFLDPQLLAEGKSFFRNVSAGKLKLLEAKPFPSGTVRLRYQPIYK